MAVSIPQSTFLDEVRSALQSSTTIPSWIAQFVADPLAMPHYSVRDACLFWKNRLVIPHDDSAFIHPIFFPFHSSVIAGHAASLRTFHRLAHFFYWPSMPRDVQTFVRHCLVCQRAKPSQLHPSALLSPLPIPERVGEDIPMHLITALPLVKRYSLIFFVLDPLSKYIHFRPLRSNYTSQQVPQVFLFLLLNVWHIESYWQATD